MMKRILTCIYACLLLFFFSTCKEEEYVYPSVLTEFTEIQTDENGALAYLLTDGGERYTILSREGLEGHTPDSIYRTVSVYRIEDEASATARLYSAQTVISDHPIPAEQCTDGIKTDPLDIQSVWLTDRYLNLILLPMCRDKEHVYQFVIDGWSFTAEGKKQLNLIFSHDQNGDYEAFTQKAYFSIPLWGLDPSLETGDRIVLHINTYKEGETTREFTLP